MASLDLRVFYTWSQVANGAIEDQGFGTTLEWDIPLLEGYAYEFVRNTCLVRPGPANFRGLQNPDLIPSIARWGADAVMVYGWNSSSHLSVLRHFHGRIPVFFRGDSTLLDERSALRSIARWLLLRWVYRYVDVAIAVGKNNRDYFWHYGLRPDQVRIAPHSVDVRRFADAGEESQRLADSWRAQLGIATEQPVVLYAGKFIRKKDPTLLLQAFRQIEFPCHLVFVGNGELGSELRRMAAGNARIHFMPFQNQLAMPSVYRVGDVFVLPSRGPGETWGLALNEAMACARPVIASSNVGAARDLIAEGANGWIFEAGNIDALRLVLQDAVVRGRDGLRGLGVTAQRSSESWTTEIAAQKIADAVLSKFMR